MIKFNEINTMSAESFLPKVENFSVKMIYIDPPYDTKSKKFEYNDSFDDWIGFMENLIIQSKEKLKDDGVIFISIDDNRLIDLRLICDKVFGIKNFLGMFITRQATRSNSKHINTIHEYVVCYAKDKGKCKPFQIKRIELPIYKDTIVRLVDKIKKEFDKNGHKNAHTFLKEQISTISTDENFSWIKNYNIIDEHGNICSAKDLSIPSKPNELIIDEIGLHLLPLETRGWQTKEKILKLHRENKLILKNGRPYEKHLLVDSTDNVMSILNFYSRQGKHDLDKFGLSGIFSTAKPVELIKYLIKICTEKDDVILDYFGGSGTTAQAVIECNQDDGGNRQFLICQTDEPIKNNDYAIKILKENGFDGTIDNIAKLRLEKVMFYYELKQRKNS